MSEEELEGESDTEGVQGVKWPITVYIDEGWLHFREARYERAIDSFNTVLETDPTNVKILLARSRCYFQLMDYEKAMVDAEEALKLNPKYPEAIYQRGEIQYTTGDFEFAYLTFQRGYKMRPSFENFRYGLQKCRAAILNAIGPESRLKITPKDIAMVEKRLSSIEKQRSSGRKVAEEVSEPLVKRRTTTINILGKAEKDRKFFHNVQKSTYVDDNIDEDDNTIKRCSKMAVDILEGRRKFWQMEKPLHARQIVPCVLRVPISKYSRCASDNELQISEKSLKHLHFQSREVENLLSVNPPKVIDLCRRSLRALDSSPTLESKFPAMTHTLDILGRAYRETGELDLAIRTHRKQSFLAKTNDLQVDEYNAIYNLAQDYIAKEDFQNAAEAFQQLLPMAENETERGYILKSVGQCQMYMENVKSAQNYMEQAAQIAKDSADLDLEVECTVLLGQMQVLAGDIASAVNFFEQARQLAIIAQNTDVQTEMEQTLKEITEKSG